MIAKIDSLGAGLSPWYRIGDDLPKLFDLEFELREPSVQEVFTEPVPDVDDPHGRFPWG
jgi:hypothetical protein